jgi:hypothetical protein
MDSVLFALFREDDPFVTRMLRTCTDETLGSEVQRLQKMGGKQTCRSLRNVMASIPSLKQFANQRANSIENFLEMFLAFYPWSTHALKVVDRQGRERPQNMVFTVNARAGVGPPRHTRAYFASGENLVYGSRISLQSKYVILSVNEGSPNLTYDEEVFDATGAVVFELRYVVSGKGQNHFACLFKEQSEWHIFDDMHERTSKLEVPLMDYCSADAGRQIVSLLFYRRKTKIQTDFCRDGREMLIDHTRKSDDLVAQSAHQQQSTVSCSPNSIEVIDPPSDKSRLTPWKINCPDDVILMQRNRRREERARFFRNTMGKKISERRHEQTNDRLPVYEASAFNVHRDQWLPPETFYCGSKDQDPWQVPDDTADPNIRAKLVYSTKALKDHRRYRNNGTLSQCAKVGMKMAFRIDNNML